MKYLSNNIIFLLKTMGLSTAYPQIFSIVNYWALFNSTFRYQYIV